MWSYAVLLFIVQTNSIFARWIYTNGIFRHFWWIWYGFCKVPTGIFGGMWIFHWRITIVSSSQGIRWCKHYPRWQVESINLSGLNHLGSQNDNLLIVERHFFCGFYHSKSPWNSSMWGICLFFFATTLNESKQFTMNSITWMPVLFKANPMWTIWEGGKKKLSFGEFLDMLLEKNNTVWVECHAWRGVLGFW